MSAYSDWHCGAIDKSEYESICRREEGLDREYMERMMMLDAMKDACIDCQYHDEETGECECGFECTNCPELGTGEGRYGRKRL